MSKKRKNLSYAEIWDDSALVDSWNEALQEYKHYHSLHARGEKVEEVLSQGENDELGGSPRIQQSLLSVSGDLAVDGETEVEEDVTVLEPSASVDLPEKATAETVLNDHATAEHAVQAQPDIADPAPRDIPSNQPSISLPTSLAVGMENEGLKNLMMSWYYAGYYTGFYEGQQAFHQSQNHANRQMNNHQATNGTPTSGATQEEASR